LFMPDARVVRDIAGDREGKKAGKRIRIQQKRGKTAKGLLTSLQGGKAVLNLGRCDGWAGGGGIH